MPRADCFLGLPGKLSVSGSGMWLAGDCVVERIVRLSIRKSPGGGLWRSVEAQSLGRRI